MSEMGLHLELFGSPTVRLDGEKLAGFITVKSRALLFYLAMKPGVHGRRSLAALLWPESPEENAAKNLRNIVSNLGRLVGPHLEITRETIGYRRDSDYYLDVEHFSALIESYRRGQADIGVLEKATMLYTGDFLEGFHVADTSAYEAWQSSEREQLRQAQLTALYTLAAWHSGQSSAGAGIEYVSRLLALDNLSESGHQLKMALLAETGRRTEALALYSDYCNLMDEELGVAPSPETTRLHSLIRSGEFEPAEWRRVILRTTFNAPLPWQADPRSISPGQTSIRVGAQRVDLGDAPREVRFYGRREELQQLRQWLGGDRCRLIAITGIGGVGKSTLAAKLVRSLSLPASGASRRSQTSEQAPDYEIIVWRSLINIPPLAEILKDWLMLISNQQLTTLPESTHEQLHVLLSFLKKRRCLLILDNFESVLEEGVYAGAYKQGYEEYEHLVRVLASSEHESCLLITSREVPKNLPRLGQDTDEVQLMRLSGLSTEPGKDLLRERGLATIDAKLEELIRHYSGNPLALKLIADTAQTVFAGDVDLLLHEMEVFGDIRDVLDVQVSRLTPVEEQLLTWLAIEREPVPADSLWNDLAVQPQRRRFMDALRSLYFRALLEQVMVTGATESEVTAHYTLQNVVMEYVSNQLVETMSREIEAGEVKSLQLYALSKANTREYVQESQHRLLLEPVARRLTGALGRAGAVEKLRVLLEDLRADPAFSPGYAAANILHLLAALGEDLHGYDFSHTAVRQADLRSVVLQDVSFRGSDLSGTIFRDTFGLISALTFSPDGRLLAARSSAGAITVWQLHEYQPYLSIDSASSFGPSLVFSPDGKILAGADKDRTIRFWDLSSGQEVRRFVGHSAFVISLLISPDGKVLCSSSEDLTIRAWDTNTGQLLRQIDTPGNIVLALASSPDGQILAAGGYDGTVYLYETGSGTPIGRIDKAHANKIRAIAFSPDGKTLATAGEDNVVNLWNVAGGSKAGSLEGHSNFVQAIAFHPSGEMLVSGSADGTIRVWNWRTGQLSRLVQGGANWITSVAYSPDGALIAGGGYDRKINLWESRSGHLLHTLQGTLTVVNEVVYSPDGKLLASCSFDQPIRIWNARNGHLVHALHDHGVSIRRLCFSPNSATLAAGGDGRWVWLWNMQTGKLQRRLDAEANFVRTMAFGKEGQLLAAGAGHEYGTLMVWDTGSGQLRFSLHNIRVGPKAGFCISPEGSLLACSDREFGLILVNSEGEIVCRVLEAHQAPIDLLCFSPDGHVLASQDREGNLKVWRVGSAGSLHQEMHLRGCAVGADYWNLEFSPDSRLVAFKVDGRRVGVADVVAGAMRFTVEESLDSEGCLAFARDSSVLMTASDTGRIRVWDAQTGACVRTLLGHTGAVLTLAANQADDFLASSGEDGIIRIWDVATGTCERMLRQPGPYEGMDISGTTGLSPAQVASLQSLGAVSQ